MREILFTVMCFRQCECPAKQKRWWDLKIPCILVELLNSDGQVVSLFCASVHRSQASIKTQRRLRLKFTLMQNSLALRQDWKKNI